MFNIFKPKPIDFISPISGEIIDLDKVSDPVFSSRSMGDGFAVKFLNGNVFSPVDGEIVALFPTNHAIGIKAVDRNEYLIHVGLDTIKYEGKGFVPHVKIGDNVKKGQLLLEVNHDFFKSNNVDMTTMILVTNLRGRKFVMIKKDLILKEKEGNIFAIKV
ncbi:MAG: PTS glucose transporter subunit IIA [Erysipelotrichaceae bacterium]|nr:PTS glucose transporter subunit IIA [Erysipelotrichaceae bacterium]